MEAYSKNLWSMAGFILALNFRITVWVIVKSPSHKIQTSTKTDFHSKEFPNLTMKPVRQLFF